MTHAAYTLHSPAVRSSCVVFASPHSGRAYPVDFLARSRLDDRAIRSSEDAFIDELFADAPRHGAPLLAALTPRAYVDFNRAPEELDPALIDGVRRLSPNSCVFMHFIVTLNANKNGCYTRHQLAAAGVTHGVFVSRAPIFRGFSLCYSRSASRLSWH